MKKLLITLLMLIGFIAMGIQTHAVGDEEIIGPDVIYKQHDKVLTMSTIKALYQASEAIEVTLDHYTGYGNIPGMYDVTFTAGEVTKNIVISVRQTLGNVIAVTKTDDEHTIHVYKNVTLSPQDIIDIMVRINYITVTSTTHISSLTNTYTENVFSPGNYIFEFRLATTSGYEDIYQVKIRVTNTEELTPEFTIEPIVKASIFVVVFTFENIILFIVLLIVIIVAIKYFGKKNNNTSKRGRKK